MSICVLVRVLLPLTLEEQCLLQGVTSVPAGKRDTLAVGDLDPPLAPSLVIKRLVTGQIVASCILGTRLGLPQPHEPGFRLEALAVLVRIPVPAFAWVHHDNSAIIGVNKHANRIITSRPVGACHSTIFKYLLNLISDPVFSKIALNLSHGSFI